jgi:RNA polymerase sigma-70 factor, ECF subfamily
MIQEARKGIERSHILLQILTISYGGGYRRSTLGSLGLCYRNLNGAGSTAMSEFHRLVEHEIPRLRRYARALTRDSVRADDLVQDTLMRGLAKSHLWQAGTDIRAWLFTIMHNQFVNDIRRAAREEASVDVEEAASRLVATADPTASRQLKELERALGQLSRGQREVVLLVGLEGMGYDEAAKILGMPIGTIRSRLARGRDALRFLLGIDAPRVCAA